MKHLYPFLKSYIALPALFFLSSIQPAQSQLCPDGSSQGSTVFNRSYSVGGSASNVQVKLPKMNPLTGMVTCVNFCVSITGILKNFKMENEEIVYF